MLACHQHFFVDKQPSVTFCKVQHTPDHPMKVQHMPDHLPLAPPSSKCAKLHHTFDRLSHLKLPSHACLLDSLARRSCLNVLILLPAPLREDQALASPAGDQQHLETGAIGADADRNAPAPGGTRIA